MSQPEMEPMTTFEAESAIESLLDNEGMTEASPEVEEESEAEVVAESNEEVTEEAEAEEAEEESEEETESEETDNEAQDSIETLAELAEALELPLEEVMANLQTTVKVNGEDIPVTLKEAFDGYQKDADYRQKTGDLAQQRRDFEEQSQGARQQLESQLIQLGQFIQNAEQQFVPQLDPTQMEYLKQTDPQRYLITKQDHDERVAQVQQLKQAAANEYVQNQQALEQQNDQVRAEILEKAGQELATRIPDWSAEAKTQVDNYLTSEGYGYTPEELSQVVDPRIVQIAHKAMLYDQQSEKASVVTKKVKTLPKVQPKGPSAKVSPKSDRLAKAKGRLKRSGSMDDAAAAVEQLL